MQEHRARSLLPLVVTAVRLGPFYVAHPIPSIVSQLLPAALDRYLAALPAMSLIPFAPLYLSCFPQRSIAGPRGPAAAGSLTPVALWRNAERGWKAERLKSESR